MLPQTVTISLQASIGEEAEKTLPRYAATHLSSRILPPPPAPRSWGGHGRTGTLIAVMLGRLYGITCASALRFTQVCRTVLAGAGKGR